MALSNGIDRKTDYFFPQGFGKIQSIGEKIFFIFQPSTINPRRIVEFIEPDCYLFHQGIQLRGRIRLHSNFNW